MSELRTNFTINKAGDKPSLEEERHHESKSGKAHQVGGEGTSNSKTGHENLGY